MPKVTGLILLILLLAAPLLPAGAAPAQKGRIIAIGAPAVEMVCALGLEERLVARSSWDTFPPSILSLPDIGNPFQPNIERILSLKPDLVLMDDRFGVLAGQLRPCNIEVLSLTAYNPAEVIPAVELLAAHFGMERRGAELIAALRAVTDLVRAGLSGLTHGQRLEGFMMVGLSDLFCVAPESGCTLLEDAGAVNLAAGMGSPFPLISREHLALSEPDFLLVPIKPGEEGEGQKKLFCQRIESVLPNIRRVLFMEEGQTYGLRSFLGVLHLAAACYPSRFAPETVAQIEVRFLKECFSFIDHEEEVHP